MQIQCFALSHGEKYRGMRNEPSPKPSPEERASSPSPSEKDLG